MAGVIQGKPYVASSRNTPDLDLCQGAAGGDPAAMRRLVERLMDRVRRTLSYLVGNPADAEDLSQVALVEILHASGSFRGESSLEHWADRIAVHQAMRFYQKKYRRDRLLTLVQDPPPAGPSMEDRLAAGRIRKRMAALLQKLSPERRTAVVMHHALGYPVAEIAVLIGAPLNTVRDRLAKGKQALRRLIARDPELRDLVEGMEP